LLILLQQVNKLKGWLIMPTLLRNLVRADGHSLSPSELLSKSVTILQGVSEGAKDALKLIDVLTVFDLATSSIFYQARKILEAVDEQNEITAYGKVPADLLDHSVQLVPLVELPGKDIEQLKGIGSATSAAFKSALSVITIRDLALWPPYRAALSILNEVYGTSVFQDDSESPKELIPRMGQLPTEQVQYEVVLFDRILDRILSEDSPGDPKLVEGELTNRLPHAIDTFFQASLVEDKSSPYSPIETAGQLDISLAARDSGYARPALGAVITLTQSWYTHGLSLGQLLHSVALAPGESTRIAMIDWTRASRASAGEDISESEALVSDLSRSRAISEVTTVVANETQSGWSNSKNVSRGAGVGLGGGVAGIGQVAGALGLSAGYSWSEGFASSNAYSEGHRDLSGTMTQNVLDSTHQASNLARNRRATIVREVSQKESEQISTRAITNYNHMHALSIQYYEVVQLYKVVVELSRITPCLFIPMKLSIFDASLTRRFRTLLANAALTPKVRALASIHPDHIAINAPHRSQLWPASSLQQLAKAIGETIGSPNSKEIILPKGFGDDCLIGLWDAAPVSQATVTFHNGSSRTYDILPSRQFLNLSFMAGGASPFDPTLGRIHTTGIPAALKIGESIHLYIRSLDGQIVQFSKSPSAQWQVHELSPNLGGVTIAGNLAAAPASSDIHLYARGTNNHLLEFYKKPSSPWQMFDLTATAVRGALVSDDPEVLLTGNDLHVFVTGENNHLLEYYKSPTANWEMFDLTTNAVNGEFVHGKPAVLLTGNDVHVYIRNPVGELVEFYKAYADAWRVFNLTTRAINSVKITTNPVVHLQDSDVHVYAVADKGRLFEYYKSPAAEWQVINLFIETGVEIAGSPAVIFTGNELHLYVRGIYGHLFELFKTPSDVWKLFDLSAIAGSGIFGGTIMGDSAALLSGDEVQLFLVGINAQLLQCSQTPQSPWQPKYYALAGDLFTRERKGKDYSEIKRIEFIKKPDREDYEGELTIGISFIGQFPFLQDSSWVALKATIKVPKGTKKFTAFEFTESIVDEELIQHLNDHSDYYHQAIWRQLDSGTLGLLLSSYSLAGRPLIEMIDPTPVSVAANYLAFRFYGAEESAWWKKFLADKGATLHERRESLIPMPSGGVFAEAVLGRFNSAEKLDITRFWNWQDSPIPITAPEISAITAGSRAQSDDLKPGQLGPSVLNVLNPPAIPDPTGLAVALQAIQNGQMFRDMSDLAVTIAAARAGMQAGVAGATEFSRQASENMAQAALMKMGRSADGAARFGSLAHGGNPAVTESATGAGLMINQGRSMDERGISKPRTNGEQLDGGSPYYRDSYEPPSELDYTDAMVWGPNGRLSDLVQTVGTKSKGGTAPGMAIEKVADLLKDVGVDLIKGIIEKFIDTPSLEMDKIEDGSSLLSEYKNVANYSSSPPPMNTKRLIHVRFDNLGGGLIMDGFIGQLDISWVDNCYINHKALSAHDKMRWREMQMIMCKKEIRVYPAGQVFGAWNKVKVSLDLVVEEGIDEWKKEVDVWDNVFLRPETRVVITLEMEPKIGPGGTKAYTFDIDLDPMKGPMWYIVVDNEKRSGKPFIVHKFQDYGDEPPMWNL
jgi:hypothetical protein